jgi:N-methylhydantoinase A
MVSPPPAGEFRVGIDIGGTFTDIVVLAAGGAVLTVKVPSTPQDYSLGIADGLGGLMAAENLAGAAVSELIHGTTIATNAILEKKGAKTALITTEGFQDVLEIGRLRMPRLYDLGWEKPEPLVPRHRRLEVRERVDHRGAVTRTLDERHAADVVRTALDLGVQSIAVCLLNAYANGAHEARIAALVRALDGEIPLSLSSEVLPEIKEYERTSTTVVNAYITPVVKDYLLRLEAALRELGIPAPLLVMQSNGGTMGVAAAAERPIHIIESGPAAGVVGGAEVARRMGYPDVITFDMGGTTAKASLVEGGALTHVPGYDVGGGLNLSRRLLKGGGYHVRVPAVDVAEVGAGGGSLVWLDRAGSLRVGPESAGAEPGPVCYGHGGRVPTVTDANVVLGFLNPEYLVGGALPIDRERAATALWDVAARPLGADLEEAAWGVHVVANATMARAVRAVTSERGRDPRQFTLMAFGGNGPVHAVTLAQSLDIGRVVVPPAPGLFSALGLLFPPIEHHYVRTHKRQLPTLDVAELGVVFGSLEAEGRRTLATEGYRDGAVHLEQLADLRYLGENSELTVPVPHTGAGVAEALGAAFGAAHEATYGYRSADEVVEIVNVRVVARGLASYDRVPSRLDVRAVGASGRRATRRRAFFGPDVGWIETPVIGRADVGRDRAMSGPLVVEEYDSTSIVPPGWQVTRDGWDDLVITKGA